MNKPFDGTDLLNRVKAKALPVAALVAGDVVDWTAESLEMNQNPYVKLLGGVVRAVKQPLIDEINKAVSNAQVMDQAPVAG